MAATIVAPEEMSLSWGIHESCAILGPVCILHPILIITVAVCMQMS